MKRPYLRRAAFVAAATAIATVAVIPRSHGDQTPSTRLLDLVPTVKGSVSPGACGSNGVKVAYGTLFGTAPSGGYYVTTAILTGVSTNSCNGMTVGVQLLSSAGAVLGQGSATGGARTGSSSLSVPLTPNPYAHDVTAVAVTITGGPNR